MIENAKNQDDLGKCKVNSLLDALRWLKKDREITLKNSVYNSLKNNLWDCLKKD